MVIHRTSNGQQLPVPYSAKKGLSWKIAGKVIGRVLLALLLILLLLAVFGTAAHAAGLVDDTVDAANEYSKYPLDNYQLDFYVDSGWDWLPWNWLDGIGKQVMYGLYAITNFIWTISLYLSNATGYLIQEPTRWTSFPLRRIPLGKICRPLQALPQAACPRRDFISGSC